MRRVLASTWDSSPLVQRRQGGRHAVETGGDLAEFVLGIDFDAAGEFARLHLAQPLAQPPQRADHIQIAGVEHDDRPADGQRHHGELEQIQNRRQPRQVLFNRQHKAVNRLDKIACRLQRNFHRRAGFGQPLLALLAGAASLSLVVAFGLLRGDWLGAVLAGIALAMALLPQEFTVVLTVLPALGAWRLSKQNVLTRRITAIETLGATSVLCVDKTGTLTENRMTVAQLAVSVGADTQTLSVDYSATAALPEAFHTLVEFSILASVAEPFDPMEKAFHRLGQHFLTGTEHLHRDWTLLQSYGLTPQLRAMSQVWESRQGTTHVVAAKGAPEAIIDLCHLDATTTAHIERDVQAMAALGLRVLGVAQAQFVGEAWPEKARRTSQQTRRS